MSSFGTRAQSLVLAVLLVTAGVAPASVGVDATPPGDGERTFHVTQNAECYEVSAYGDGDTSVEDFYDYRRPGSDPAAHTYSSHGTRQLQANQVSNVFVYHGADGYSLVMLHDEVGNAPHGSTVTFELTGLPTDREWVVEDDAYVGRDDEFDHRETSSTITWKWAPNRTDGAAVRGLGGDDYDAVTIDPAFNEAADAWGEWHYSGGDHRVHDWRLLDADGTAVSLAMDRSASVAPGGCDDDGATTTTESTTTTTKSTQTTTTESTTTTTKSTTTSTTAEPTTTESTTTSTTAEPTTTTTEETSTATMTTTETTGTTTTSDSTQTTTTTDDSDDGDSDGGDDSGNGDDDSGQKPLGDDDSQSGVERSAIGVADLTVVAENPSVGESVEVVAVVENEGLADGTWTATVTVDGESVAVRNVTVPAGETREVVVTHAFETAGDHAVEVGDESVTVTVEAAEPSDGETTDGETAANSDTASTHETTLSTTDAPSDAKASDSAQDDSESGGTGPSDSGAGVSGFGGVASLAALAGLVLVVLRRG
jgi:hypothetical protein